MSSSEEDVSWSTPYPRTFEELPRAMDVVRRVLSALEARDPARPLLVSKLM